LINWITAFARESNISSRMAIVLPDLLDPRRVELNLRARSPENAFRQLVSLLSVNEHVREPEKFLGQIMERERANSSLVEHGVAFPHARTDLVDTIVLAIGRSRAGVAFGAPGARAQLIFLIGVPQRLVSDYLICVGALARMAKDDHIRAQLLAAKTADEFVEALRTNAAIL
jgi:mannitol/fructose-specific phosphotransferase system IIA component (Ntr-type)